MRTSPAGRGVSARCAPLAAALLLGSCAVGPDFHPPQTEAPPHYRADERADERAGDRGDGGADALPPAEPARWWHALGDARLDALVDRGLHANLDLDIALTRLQQARTLEVALTGLALPRLEADSGGARGTGSDLTRGRVPGTLQSADHTIANAPHIDQINGGAAYWDIDLFGRLRRQVEAARYDAQAAAAARDAVQVEVIAEVARAYLELRGLQTQLAVLRQNLQAARSLMDFVQARYEHGITNELDVTLAQRQLAAVQAQAAPLAAQVQDRQDQLAVLLGRFPEELAAELAQAAPMPALPARIAPGQPLDLIRRRPDIRTAEWALAGATARAGVAAANLFPQLSLGAGAGLQGEGNGFIPGSRQSVWSLGYAATLPLLDFGVLDAFARVADLEAHAQLLQYRQTVLRAVQDVDSALAAFDAQQDRLARLGDAVAAGERATVLATERYERGLTDFLNVADAQRQEYDLEGQYAAAQTALADAFVGAYRALGGGWESFGEPPPLPASQPAVVAMFRRLFDPRAGL
jgi:NodT family efflux transporter outer membrane factor (OMF) lipoprotein